MNRASRMRLRSVSRPFWTMCQVEEPSSLDAETRLDMEEAHAEEARARISHQAISEPRPLGWKG